MRRRRACRRIVAPRCGMPLTPLTAIRDSSRRLKPSGLTSVPSPRDHCEVIEAAGRLVVPGFINAHYHSHDTLCRGLFEELPLEMWLLYTLPMGQNRSKEEVRARTLVGALESLRCGITTVQDMLGLVPLDDDYTEVVITAYRGAGIRVVFSPMV